VELADVLRRLPIEMVFDHLASPPLPAGIAHPSHRIVRELIDQGRAWVKLSGAYSNSKFAPPSYPEATTIARDFVKAAPERLMWGSDWPHPSLSDDHKPDDALLFDLLSVWVPRRDTRSHFGAQSGSSLRIRQVRLSLEATTANSSFLLAVLLTASPANRTARFAAAAEPGMLSHFLSACRSGLAYSVQHGP
jgi:hypothetical protein